MKKDTFMGVWQHLMNAEALANGALLALQKKDMPSEQEVVDMQRVGELAAKISRTRRDWEYWFIPPAELQGEGDMKQNLRPFEKRWYTE